MPSCRVSNNFAHLYITLQSASSQKDEFKVGIHSGAVVVEQMGEYKCEVVFIADVVNTASRISNKCTELHSKLLISNEFYTLIKDNTDLEKFYAINYDAKRVLRGKIKETELLSVNRR
ncbi:MAG: hypothetical protein PF637_08545 [Spirochaetes bacterium]|jgi:class 3 adenylate cyclase|nr:hypothetical protein [Spirochaetota bacterium]